MTGRAYAKVNLALDVLTRRDDGYHELAGIMHSIDLYDVISIDVVAGGDIDVTCTEPLPFENTAYRAAYLYFALFGKKPCLHIHIEKHIPSMAGLGGASADAACVLRMLNEMYGALSEEDIYNIAEMIGADVPFCLHGGCAFAEGKGERLTSIPTQELTLVLVKGSDGISTKELFGRHDKICGDKAPDQRLQDALSACKIGDRDLLVSSVFNTLETAAFDYLPCLAETKKAFTEKAGALNALMTGSGSCIYGIYADERSALAGAEIMRKSGDYEFVKVVHSF